MSSKAVLLSILKRGDVVAQDAGEPRRAPEIYSAHTLFAWHSMEAAVATSRRPSSKRAAWSSGSDKNAMFVSWVCRISEV